VSQSFDPSFNLNLFVAGSLIAVVLSAIGYSESDATLQWIVPGIVVVVATIAALFVPERRRKRKAPPS